MAKERKTWYQLCLERSPGYAMALDLSRTKKEIEAGGGIPLMGIVPNPETILNQFKLDAFPYVMKYMDSFSTMMQDRNFPGYVCHRYYAAMTDLRESFATDTPGYFDFENFNDYFDQLLGFGLFSKMADLEDLVVGSDLSPREKAKFMADYSIVQHLPELNEFDHQNLDSWYEKTAEVVGFDSVDETKIWLNKVFTSRAPLYYADCLPILLKNGHDLNRAIDVLPFFLDYSSMHADDLRWEMPNLGFVIDADIPLEEKTIILKNLNDNKRYLEILPLDTLDIHDWLARAEAKASKFVNEEFGLSQDYSLQVCF